MPESFADPAAIIGYHAHLYYAPETGRLPSGYGRPSPFVSLAARIGIGMTNRSGHIRLPCTRLPLQRRSFAHLVPWLMLNREGLNVLVHPLTQDSVADHTHFALWLGSPLTLRVEVLRRGPRAG